MSCVSAIMFVGIVVLVIGLPNRSFGTVSASTPSPGRKLTTSRSPSEVSSAATV